MTCGDEDELAAFAPLRDPLVAELSADLARRGWFSALPFTAIELVVQVHARDRRWDPLPQRAPNEDQIVLVRVPRPVVKSGDAVALRTAIMAEVAAGVDALERRYRLGTPRFLR